MERVITIVVILAALALAGFAVFGPKSQQSADTVLKEAKLTLTNYAITPNRVNLASGRVKFVFENQTGNIHAIEIFDPVEQKVILEVKTVRPHSNFTIWVDLVGGRRYEIYDPVWRNRGMQGILITK